MAEQEAIGRRDAAFRGMAAEGMTRAQLAAAVRERLAAELTPEQILQVGVSTGNVRLVLSRPKQ